MFLLAGQPLSPDTAFVDVNGIQRPANWLRLASNEERLEAGVTEVADPPAWDQRFYWGYDGSGSLIPKDHGQLVQQWSQQTRKTANSLLEPTDWLVIREADNGTAVGADIKGWREDLRLACGLKVSGIAATASTDELATFVTSAEYASWPPDPRLSSGGPGGA